MLRATWSSTPTRSPSCSSAGSECSERFDEPWYPGEALVTTVFVEQGGKTTLTATMRYESREARDAVMQSPMEGGVAQSYDKLAEILASGEVRGTKSRERP